MKKIFLLISFLSLLTNNLSAQTYSIIRVDLECEVKPILSDAINTHESEFAPFVSGDYFYFSSDRNPDVMMDGENSWANSKHINLFQGKIKGDVNENVELKGVRLVSERFNYGSHTGPASFSASGDTIFVSQVRADGKTGTFRPQLFYAIKYNSRFTKLTPLLFNDPAYTMGHPFYDSANKRLYFSSNLPGGKGGKDIFYSDLTDSGWSKPVPFDLVNSESDEMYPFIVDNILFFTSDRNADKGGINIHWKTLNTEQPVEPLKGVNSSQNDFAFFALAGLNRGFLSSNRNGQDDIFFFDIKRGNTIRREMSGTLTYKTISGLPANIAIQIVDENDFILYETKTDDKGQFVFKDIDYDKSYTIRAIAEEDLLLALNDQNGEVVANMTGDEDNYFVYRHLQNEKNGTLNIIPENMMDFKLDQGHLTAQIVYEDDPGKYPANKKIVLIDGAGKEFKSTYTDAQGNFEFKKLSLKDNYLLTIPEVEEDVILLVYDIYGNVVAELKTNQQGTFTYRKINGDYTNKLQLQEEEELAFESNNQTIWGYFEYDSKPNANREGLIVKAFDEEGNLLAEEVTNKEGVFRFRNLPAQNSILFQLEESGESFVLDDLTLYIYDRNGKKIAGLRRGQDGYFTFRPLGHDSESNLSMMEEEHMEFILGDMKQRDYILVYFDSNQSQVKSEDKRIINNLYKVLKENPDIKIEINAYADARSSDEYNLILSKKRGDWIVSYLTSKGISKSRFIVNACGEARLVDERNDALNRRAEIHLY